MSLPSEDRLSVQVPATFTDLFNGQANKTPDLGACVGFTLRYMATQAIQHTKAVWDPSQ